ncbi:hypothetical protein [Aestuariibaculum suncheonense]|uniref:Uncharacterized protein n=1 Tax=Aestuariibaculum suncheonense TaxID=1028745 RepID=A0A8J6UCJ7_9FLAO|nr:hypothetical protein [Aestuariibaculum suncheonense]MBD0836357.1 hypothetical protein [Aestuariibaculum suncheonense]
MKIFQHFILVFVLSAHCNAQKEQIVFPEMRLNSLFKQQVKFNSEITINESFKFCAEPQFGGLFEKSFKYIEGVANFNQFYNYFDFGLNLGIKHKINSDLKLKGICNLGMLRFRSFDVVKPDNYLVKISLSYVF